LLARVRDQGFIDDYQGVRIAKDGVRFRISGVAVWLVVVEGPTHGQAALFREWAPASAVISVADGAGRERYPRAVRCALRPKIRFEPAVPSLFGRSSFPSVGQ
jgi:MEKHLA domain